MVSLSISFRLSTISFDNANPITKKLAATVAASSRFSSIHSLIGYLSISTFQNKEKYILLKLLIFMVTRIKNLK
jgi:hypothetical protein